MARKAPRGRPALKPGRPPTHAVACRLPEAVYLALKQIADADRRPIAMTLTLIVEDWVAARQGATQQAAE